MRGALLVLAACAAPGVDSTAPLPVGSPTATGPGTTPSTLSADCAATDNPLRFRCQVEVQPPQAVDVVFWRDGEAERRFSSEQLGSDHTLGLFLMKELTTYTWRAEARLDPTAVVSGQLTSGALEGGCRVDSVVFGQSTAPYTVVQSPCSLGANVLVVDADGDVVWCEDFSPTETDGMIEGVSLTEDGTLLALVHEVVLEKDFMGNELLRLSRGIDFDEHIHHDAFRKDGRTYMLFNERVAWQNSDYTLDGFYVFEGTNKLGEWHLFDHFQPAGIWPGGDYSHANAIWTDGGGQALVSLRHLSAVAAVVADPAAADFGEIAWRLAGEGLLPEFGSDFHLESSAGATVGFERQHNVHFLPSGELTFLDNRASRDEPSRLLHVALDPVGAVADITAAYTLDRHCDIQGGAWHTSAGNPVATCAPDRRATEFDAASGVQVWEMALNCSGGNSTYTPRFIPWNGP